MSGDELASVSPLPPYKDEDLMRRLYQDEMMSMTAMAEQFDCSSSTIRKYLDKFGIETRELGEQISIGYGNGPTIVPMNTKQRGHEIWNHHWKQEHDTVAVHRLVAVAKYGIDAVHRKVVHHKNGIPWDNRPQNLELMEHGDHSVHHRTKGTWLDRLRVAELYENGDVGSYKLAREIDLDIGANTVRNIHEEFYGGDAS